jgi:hypothetical protein
LVQEAEAVGQFTTAAAAASVVDASDPHGERAEGAACLNCGAAVHGHFCAQCGQRAHLHRSVWHAAEEFLHGIVHFDGKLWNTLPLLVARPGKLTWDYVHGKRARFISPIALFLLTVFLMFLVLGSIGNGPVPEALTVPADATARAEALDEAERALAGIEAELARARADPTQADNFPGLVATRETARLARDRLRTAPAGTVIASGESISGAIRAAAARGDVRINLGNPELEKKALAALSQPEFVFYKMKQKGYKLFFLLVPLSLPWIALLFFWKPGVHLYDHVVFLLYSISFMSLLFLLVAVLATAGLASEALIATLVGLVPGVHLFLQLKEGYRLGWFAAAWRTAALGTAATLTLGLYFALILVLGLID